MSYERPRDERPRERESDRAQDGRNRSVEGWEAALALSPFSDPTAPRALGWLTGLGLLVML